VRENAENIGNVVSRNVESAGNVVANAQNVDNVVANEVVFGHVWLLNFEDWFATKCNSLRTDLIECYNLETNLIENVIAGCYYKKVWH